MTDAIQHRPKPPQGAAWAQMRTLLVGGESVTAFALEHRLYALLHRRHAAAATTGRFILMSRPLLGGYSTIDVRWQDLKDARLTVGMFSATVQLTYDVNLSDTASGEAGERTIRASSLRREEAQALYRECQAQEQAWREKRRVRSIEEMRAQAGGVQVATGVYPPGSGPDGEPFAPLPLAQDDSLERLSRAKDMLDKGLITDAEYEAIKGRIVSAL